MESGSLDYALVKDFFDAHERTIVNEMNSQAPKICKDVWHSNSWTDDANVEAARRIQEEFLHIIRMKLHEFCRDIESNKTFKSDIWMPFNDKKTLMADEWKKTREGEGLFDSVEVLTTVDTKDLQITSFDFKGEAAIDLPFYSWEFLKDFLTLGIRRLFQSPDDRIDKFFQEKKPVEFAYNAFKGDNRNTDSLAQILGTPRRNLVEKLTKSFTEMKARLESNSETREKTAKESNERREVIAREAQKIRETIVEPYMENLESFEKEVCRFYAE